jgi:hypothetical protein
MGDKALRKSNDSWRKKAIDRRKENCALRKKVKELETSRNGWKRKAMEAKKLLTRKECFSTSLSPKPKRHHYSAFIMALALCLMQLTNKGFRSCRQSMLIFASKFNLNIKIPSYSTILLWSKKYGLYNLERAKNIKKGILIIDESIKVGKERLLVVLGVDEAYKFNKPLSHKDVVPLAIRCSDQWKGEQVAKVLDEVNTQVDQVIYSVSDKGNNLKKAFKLSEIQQVEDCTHVFARILENLWKNDASMKAFLNKVGNFRKKVNLGRYSFLMPPKQSKRARFMNLSQVIKWASNVIAFANRQDKKGDDYQKIKWVLKYRAVCERMLSIHKAMHEIMQRLKENGMSEKTISICEKIKSSVPEFDQEISKYLEKGRTLLKQLKQKKLICSSDVIESIFGKFKNMMSPNPATGITDLSLNIASFSGSLEEMDVLEAMEKIKAKDVQRWRKENIKESTQEKRKRALKVNEEIVNF